MHRCVGLCSFLVLALSCGPRKPNYVNGYDPPEPPAIVALPLDPSDAVVAACGKLPYCVYALDFAQGTISRFALDGSHKELVMDFGRELPPTMLGYLRPGGQYGGSRLVVYPLPGPVPSTAYIDEIPQGATPTAAPYWMLLRDTGFYQITPTWTPTRDLGLPCSDTGKPCSWNLRLTSAVETSQSRHATPIVHTIEFYKGAARTRQLGGQPQFVGLLSPGAAVVKSEDRLLLWVLATDKLYLLASSPQSYLWPRDLSKPERFRSYAYAQVRDPVGPRNYRWFLSSPTDIVAKPGYIVDERWRKPASQTVTRPSKP